MHEKTAKAILAECLCSMGLRHVSRARMKKLKSVDRPTVSLVCVCVCVCVKKLRKPIKYNDKK